MMVVGFEVLLGSLTVTGSLMAFGKLQEIIKGAPVIYPFQNLSNIILFFSTVSLFIILIFNPGLTVLFYFLIIAGLLLGVLMVLPIGGADMPVVLALLNSYSGLAAAATGFAIDNKMLNYRRGVGWRVRFLPLHDDEQSYEPLICKRFIWGGRQRKGGTNWRDY